MADKKRRVVRGGPIHQARPRYFERPFGRGTQTGADRIRDYNHPAARRARGNSGKSFPGNSRGAGPHDGNIVQAGSVRQLVRRAPMFRKFAKFLTDVGVNGPEVVTRLHPSDLTALLELAWDRRSNNTAVELGLPSRRSALNGFGTTWFGNAAFSSNPPDPNVATIVTRLRTNFGGPSFIGRASEQPGGLWEHLMYGYMVENTRVMPIMRRVLREFAHGEQLAYQAARVPAVASNYRAAVLSRSAVILHRRAEQLCSSGPGSDAPDCLSADVRNGPKSWDGGQQALSLH